jgi:PIN domain nuclease of toxin-antitoxin system
VKYFITDTHPLIWYFIGSKKLPLKVSKVFDRAMEGELGIWVPIIGLLEVSLLEKAGKIRLSKSLETFMSDLFDQSIILLDLSPQDVLKAHSFNFSKDLFDNLIVAMAQRIECPLITGDSVIHKANLCRVFWD